MRIGIYGGTFNPPHLGHINVIDTVYKLLDLDKVVIIPAGMPYMKDQNELAPPEDRIKMCNTIITKRSSYAIVSRKECDRNGPSYTIDTVRELKETRPFDELYLILGVDAFNQLKDWKEPDELAKLVTFVVFNRGDTGYTDYVITKYNLEHAWLKKEITSVFIETPRIQNAILYDSNRDDISSSDIRKRIKENRPFKYLLSQDVANYIAMNKLYGYKGE